MNTAELLETATEAVQTGGTTANQLFWQSLTFETKGNVLDTFSEADTRSDDAIRQTITGRHPTHGLVSEESAKDLNPDGPVIWLIDSIDGTNNFKTKRRPWSVQVGAVHENHFVAAAALQPQQPNPSGKLFLATSDQLSTCDGEPIAVSKETDPKECLIGMSYSSDKWAQSKATPLFDQIVTNFKYPCISPIASDPMLKIATGKLGGGIFLELSLWDLPPMLIIEQAGGIVTDLDGKPIEFTQPLNRNSLQTVVASNGHIHDALIEAAAEL